MLACCRGQPPAPAFGGIPGHVLPVHPRGEHGQRDFLHQACQSSANAVPVYRCPLPHAPGMPNDAGYVQHYGVHVRTLLCVFAAPTAETAGDSAEEAAGPRACEAEDHL